MAKAHATLPYRDPRIPMRSKIANGVYIDFEGFANPHQRFPPPVLIGLHCAREGKSFGEGFHQVVFTKAFRWAAEDAGMPHQVVYCEDREGFLGNLVEKSCKSKPLFAFTEHEFGFLEELVGSIVRRRYRNVRLIAKRWCNREVAKGKCEAQFLDVKPIDWSLREVAGAMGFTLTEKLPTGGVTNRLRKVKEYSHSKASWEAAPAATRRAWREVLKHNREDVRLIYEMMNRMRPQ